MSLLSVTIQLLPNAVGGGVSDFPDKKRYEGVWLNVIIIMRGLLLRNI